MASTLGGRRCFLADGYFNQPLQTEPAGLTIGGSSVPSIIVVCDNCGYMSQHALGILGLLDNGEASGEAQ